ncbi:MAG: hypothetical protein IPJ00_21070, partial [Saprospirales bacterium]|nr:hypothetical protein [Saprospirales bacterium]
IRSELSLKLQNERLRISRDLHDNLGAELTIVGGALSRRAHISASLEERSALETIALNIRQAMALLREVSGRSGMSSFPSKVCRTK